VRVEARLEAMGLNLPQPFQLPPGLERPFAWVREYRGRAFISGHESGRESGRPSSDTMRHASSPLLTWRVSSG
jgi:hypothetical protein